MLLLDFVGLFVTMGNSVNVVLDWIWEHSESDPNGKPMKDEEYSFEGLPEDFIDYYTEFYDNLDGFTIFDVNVIHITTYPSIKIYIKIVR